MLWILGLGLAAGAALFLAWRLVPAESRQGAVPRAAPAAPAPRTQPADLRAVEAHEPEASTTAPAPDGRVRAQAAPEVVREADGIEEGGLARAARPLPDFSAKYGGQPRTSKALALRGLEEAIRAGQQGLSAAERSELEARLANTALPQPPIPKLAELMALIDEREWLVQALAGPESVDG